MSGEFDEARVKLVMRHPFFGSLILQLPEKEISTAGMMKLTGHPTAAVVCTIDKISRRVLRQELWYCKSFVDKLTRDQRMGLLAHEVLHLALGHPFPWRRGRRTEDRWGAASDYVVNLIVRDAGLELPPNGMLNERYREMTVEQVYDKLPANQQGAPQSCPPVVIVVEEGGESEDKDGKPQKGKGKGPQVVVKQKKGKGDDGDEGEEEKKGKSKGKGDDGEEEEDEDGAGGGKPEDGEGQDEDDGEDGEGDGCEGEGEDEDELDMSGMASPSDLKDVEEKWKNALVRAVLMARAQGKCPAGLERMVDDLITPKIPWQTVLERYLCEVLKNDYDFSRPDRRFLGGVTVVQADGTVNRDMAMYLPDLYSEGDEVAVGVDTSGSIGEETLRNFASEVVGMLRAKNVKKVRLMCCDAAVTLDETLGPGDPLPKKFPGGGGTDFRPVFDLVKDAPTKPKALIYMTDLMGSFPEKDDEPPYPVVWLRVDRQYEPPFGVALDYEATDDPV